MAEEIRFGVLLAEGVRIVEELEAILPPPWQCHYRTKRDAKGVITCVAPISHGTSGEELREKLNRALGDADFVWEEIKNGEDLTSTYIKPERISLTTHPVLNEKWVQNLIAEDPSILGLGDLVLRVYRTRFPGHKFVSCGGPE